MLASAAKSVRLAAATALRPPPRIELSEWSARHRVLPTEVTANAGRWSNDLFPFIVEIMDCLSPWHPAETVTFCKSAQVAGTESGLNWMFAIADMWPAPTLMVHPTIQAAQAWVREKLAPSLRATPAVRTRVVEQRSRDGASTTLFKSFPGGFWVITGSNSAADISSKSIRNVIKEEWDRWALDVDGQGDPDKLVDARQTSYHASGKAKSYRASTPTIVGVSRIWPAYLAGDRRRYRVPCPDCGEAQVLNFFPDANGRGGLIFERQAPFQARYACAHCGVLIEHHRKREMLAGGRWVAENPGPARQPSFHISALYSPVTTWDKMAEAFLESKDDPTKYKAFVNLWLGEAWEERGDAPEWQRLYARRGDYAQGSVPHGGLVLTGAADVQKDGIFYEVVAWGAGRVSWSIDVGFLPGDTADPDSAVWRALAALRERAYPDAYGNARRIDAFAVDSGYNSAAVYAWVRGRPDTFAVKGQDGWFHPPIGTPGKIDINYRGDKKRRGLAVWPVGTYGLKSELYANLRKAGREEGAGDFHPPGYCHFSEFHDERFFQQLTSEHVAEREHKGRIVKEWRATGPNHYHDCRVYNMAMADHLGLSRMTDGQWVELAKARSVPPEKIQADLFAPMGATPPAAEPARAEPEVDESTPTPRPPSRPWVPKYRGWGKRC
ncbi:phage terminase large subunit family protein [Paludisphaera rhizosphaerae]|uniref:phage terminase large subunit family protein n=1 Tax=Paludisphaera rhizosphaerae TaxID=2711216 RepID=UPI0013EDD0E6|nr:terminase gpA endonuclease subunit [Paludisphaera rhizosphaerae]